MLCTVDTKSVADVEKKIKTNSRSSESTCCSGTAHSYFVIVFRLIDIGLVNPFFDRTGVGKNKSFYTKTFL